MGQIKRVEIDEATIVKIREIIKEEHRYRVRKRAKAILYKSQEYSVKEIAKILEVRTDTVYAWICKYELEGVDSFYDKQGRGRKTILQDSDADKIKELLINSPSIPVANAKLRDKLKIFVHDKYPTIRKYSKEFKRFSKKSTTE